MRSPFTQGHGRAGRLGILIPWVVLGAIIAAGTRSGTAQSTPGDQTERKSKPQPDPTGFIEREEVRFVTLDLVVEEHGGPGGKGWHLARELTKNQIRVFVGGREMALDLFENWCAGVPPVPPGTIASGPSAGGASVVTESAGAGSPPQTSTGDSSGNGAAAPPAFPSQKYILYFDLQHLTLGGRNRAFRSAMEWAGKTVKSGDEVMILAGGWSLRVVRPLLPVTGSLQEDIQHAMEDFTSDDLWAEGEWRRRDEIKRMSRRDRRTAEITAQGYTAVDQDVTRRSLENLRGLMALFGTVPGTKNLVFFGETVRLVPGSEYYEYLDDPMKVTAGFTPDGAAGAINDVAQDLEQLVEAANERNVRIYAVQPAGLDEGSDIEGAMTMLATETGGSHVQGTNQIGLILDRVAEDLACFYRIGFRMSPRHSGSTERILVRIGESDTRYRARYRRTLTDPTREQQEEEALLAAYLAPAAVRAFPVSVRARPLFDHPAGTRFRIEVSVPLEALLTRPSPSAGGGVATLLIGGQVVPLRSRASLAASRDRDPWAEVDPKKKTWGFDRRAEIRLPAFKGGSRSPSRAVYVNEFDAPPGEYRIVAVAEDGLTRSVSTGLADLTARTSTAILGEPLVGFLDPGVLIIGSATPTASKEGAGGDKLMTVTPAGTSIPAKLSVASQGDPVSPDSLTLLYPVCLPSERLGKSRGAGGAGTGTLPWKIHHELTCGESSTQLPPLALPEISQGEGCVLVTDPVGPELLHPGPCRMEVSLEGPGAPQEVRVAQFQVDSSGPLPKKSP